MASIAIKALRNAFRQIIHTYSCGSVCLCKTEIGLPNYVALKANQDWFCENILTKLIDNLHALLSTNHPSSNCVIEVLLKEFIAPNFSSDVLARFLKLLYNSSTYWPYFSPGFFEILSILQHCSSPTAYFQFLGDESSFITLPPSDKWPSQTGWTFHCWLRRQSFDGEEERGMYLYCFQTDEGLGFTAHFLEGTLVLTVMRNKNKSHQFCVKFGINFDEWYMLTVVYVYNRWSYGDIRCYINGSLAADVELSWNLSSYSVFKHCHIGRPPNCSDGRTFCGQITNLMGFTESLSPEQISCIYALGVDYQGQFRFENEPHPNLNPTQLRVLYDANRLQNSLAFAYHPLACDRQLCLNQAQNYQIANSVIQSSFHAVLVGNISVFVNSSISSLIFKLGGIQLFYPLLNRLDWPVKYLDESEYETILANFEFLNNTDNQLHLKQILQNKFNTQMATVLLRFLFNLISQSTMLCNQFIVTKGLLILSHTLLNQNTKQLLTMEFLNTLLEFTRYLIKETCSLNKTDSGEANLSYQSRLYLSLLKQIYGYLLSNIDLWSKASIDVQEQLYQFLTTDFMSVILSGQVGRTGTFHHCLEALKYYFALTDTRLVSGFELRTPNRLPLGPAKDVFKLRTNLIIYIKRLVARDGISDGEMQMLLNFLITVQEPENKHDVLYLLTNLLIQYPKVSGPSFVRADGLQCVFNLLNSSDEHVRIYAIKLFGLFLINARVLIYGVLVERFGLFSLLEERLNTNSSQLTLLIYNALIEVLTESISAKIRANNLVIDQSMCIIKNPGILKVISRLISRSEQTVDILSIKDMFLDHLHILCVKNSFNKKAILQLYIWQDWLLNLVPLYPTTKLDTKFLYKLLQLFQCLICYGLFHEHGSWQVLVDTFALIHLHLSEENYTSLKEKQIIRSNQQLSCSHSSFDSGLKSMTSPSTSILNSTANIISTAAVDVNGTDISVNSTNKNVSDGIGFDLTESVARRLLNHLSTSKIEDTVKHQTKTELSLLATKNNPESQVICPSSDSNSIQSTDNNVNDNEQTEMIKKDLTKLEVNNSDQTKFRLPDFKWSYLHHILLDQILYTIEHALFDRENKKSGVSIEYKQNLNSTSKYTDLSGIRLDFLNRHLITNPNLSMILNSQTNVENENNFQNNLKTEKNQSINQIFDESNDSPFCTNLIHLISYLSDLIVGACGGLLPLLASASSSTSEIGNLESVPGLDLNDAVCFMLRLAYLADFCLFEKNLDFNVLESEHGLPSGGLTRQLLRLYLTATLRNCLEFRLMKLLPSMKLVTGLKYLTGDQDELLFYSSNSNQHNLHSLKTDSKSLDNGELTIYERNNPRSEIDITSKEYGLHKHHRPHSHYSKNNKYAEQIDHEEFLLKQLLLISKLNFFQNTQFNSSSSSSSSSFMINRLGLYKQPWIRQCDIPFNEYMNISTMKEEHCKKIQHLSLTFQQLIYAVKPHFNYPEHYYPEYFEKTVISSLRNSVDLLQDIDLKRLSALINKSEHTSKMPEFLAMSIVYTVSVMMVSKYRDLLEPNRIWYPYGKQSESQTGEKTKSTPNRSFSSQQNCVSNQSFDSSQSIDCNENKENLTASVTNESEDWVHSVMESIESDSSSLTDELNSCLGKAASFLKDLFVEFISYFTKTLIGTHGQTLLSSAIPLLQSNSSPVELVMLLCSQEWQTSLQKYSGWAFIELVNEGRLLSHSIRDHIYRIAIEGDTLLNQLKLNEIKQNEKFEQLSIEIINNLIHDKSNIYEEIIQSNIKKNSQSVNYLLIKSNCLVKFILSNWIKSDLGKEKQLQKEFYRLDSWEDDSRRHRRLIPNPYGTNHSEAIYNLKRTENRDKNSDQTKNLIKAEQLKNILQETVQNSTNETSVQTSELEKSIELSETNSQSIEMDFKQDHVNLFTTIWSEEDTLYPGRLCIDFKDTTHLSVPCILVCLGMSVHGTLSFSNQELFFEQDINHVNNQSIDQKILAYIEHVHSKWLFSEIRAIFSRSFLHRKIALEIFVASRGSVLFAFTDFATMKLVVHALPQIGIGHRYGLPMTYTSSLASPKEIFQLSNMTKLWQQRELSNFDYLMYLNTIAGRSYNDLNQYPIFPWIISNYETNELDLSQPTNYRDLSKPIGAINPKRKSFFDERYKNWYDDQNQLDSDQDSSHKTPPFHYGTHYSTAAFVLNYLIRIEPFTTVFLNLQGGKFDHPDRIFFSIAKTWENCQINTSDVKELIPEFFYFPEMFENINNLTLGITEDGINVNNVILPPWAKSPEEFIRIHREALESELVSCQLHHWIDLIFGYKQRGPEAVQATNVFYYLTYDDSVNWDKITDPILIRAVEDQIQSFGQTPAQLLTKPHPPRNSALHHNPQIFNLLNEELYINYKFQSNSPIILISLSNHHKNNFYPFIITMTHNRTFTICRWNDQLAESSYRKALLNSSRDLELSVNSNLTDSRIQDSRNSLSLSSSSNRIPITLPESSLTTSPTTETTSSSPPTVPSDTRSVHSPFVSPTLEMAASVASLSLTTDNVHSPNTNTTITTPTSSNCPIRVEFTSSLGRCLASDFDQNLPGSANQFVFTSDLKAVITCGYYDRSFRIYGLKNSRLIQAVFGHHDMVTCVTRSECRLSHYYYYLASGSRDCTILLWLFNAQHLCVVGEGDQTILDLSPSPIVVLNGHEASITCISLSAELGLVLSGSENGTCLLHSLRGELLRRLIAPISLTNEPSTSTYSNQLKPNILLHHREGYLVGQFGYCWLNCYTLNGKIIKSQDMSSLATINQNYQINTIIFSDCGHYLLLGGNDGVVWILRSYNLTPIHTFPRCDYSVESLCLGHDQKFLFVGLSSGSLVVFYVDFNQWHHEFQHRYL